MSSFRMSPELAELALRLHIEEGWGWSQIQRRLNQWTHSDFAWGTYASRAGELRRQWVRRSLKLMNDYASWVLL